MEFQTLNAIASPTPVDLERPETQDEAYYFDANGLFCCCFSCFNLRFSRRLCLGFFLCSFFSLSLLPAIMTSFIDLLQRWTLPTQILPQAAWSWTRSTPIHRGSPATCSTLRVVAVGTWMPGFSAKALLRQTQRCLDMHPTVGLILLVIGQEQTVLGMKKVSL